MTRIIAGTAKGRRLKVPQSFTRPTSDRVRESVFSSLESVLDFTGLRILDLFAGSGALGLEAASRGAQDVVLVDNAPSVVKVMDANIASLGIAGVRAVKSTARAYLDGSARPFDVVFLDPPYEVPALDVAALLRRLVVGWLAPQAVVVVERGAFDAEIDWPLGFDEPWRRRFGDTHVLRAVWYGHSQQRPRCPAPF